MSLLFLSLCAYVFDSCPGKFRDSDHHGRARWHQVACHPASNWVPFHLFLFNCQASIFHNSALSSADRCYVSSRFLCGNASAVSSAKAMSSVMLDKLRDEGGGGEVCFSFREAQRSEAALLSIGFSVPILQCTPFSFSLCQTCSSFCPFQLFSYMKCILQVSVKFPMRYP